MKKVINYIYNGLELCCSICHYHYLNNNHKVIIITDEKSLKIENITLDIYTKDFNYIIDKTKIYKNKIGKEITKINNLYEKINREVTKSFISKHEKLIKEENELKEKLKNEVNKVKENLEKYLYISNNYIKLSEKINKGINKLDKNNKEMENIIKIMSYITKINKTGKEMNNIFQDMRNIKITFNEEQSFIKYEDYYFNEKDKKEEKKEGEPSYESNLPEDEPKKELPKMDRKKIALNLYKFTPFLTYSELLKVASISKEFKEFSLPKMKEMNNKQLEKEKKELEALNTNSTNHITQFSMTKIALKAIECLNNNKELEYFQSDDVPTQQILLLLRVLYQIINKEKEILKVKEDKQFWKLFKENIIKNSEKGLGEYLQYEFNNIDCSVENIHKIHCLCEGKEKILNPRSIPSKDNAPKLISILVNELLEYIGINIVNKFKLNYNHEIRKNYLEYIIKNRKDIDDLISKM